MVATMLVIMILILCIKVLICRICNQNPEYEEVIVSASRANPGGEQDDVEMMKNASYGPTQLDSKQTL